LTAKGAHFRSLRDPIDTTTPQGMFSLQVLGAVAQLERALISERTKAGIRAAKAKGKLPGNPGVRERRPEALAKMTAAQKAAYGARIQATANQWLPTVRRMRPDHTWDDIARVLKQRGLDWTPERLRRAVKWLVAEHMADPGLTQKVASPPAGRPADDAGRRHARLEPGADAPRARRPPRAAARTDAARRHRNGRHRRSRTSSTGLAASGLDRRRAAPIRHRKGDRRTSSEPSDFFRVFEQRCCERT
jgi:hypothetical protein